MSHLLQENCIASCASFTDGLVLIMPVRLQDILTFHAPGGSIVYQAIKLPL